MSEHPGRDEWGRTFDGLSTGYGRRKHCKHGHELRGSNLRVLPNGSRACRACNRAASRRYHQRHAEAERLRSAAHYAANRERRLRYFREARRAKREAREQAQARS